MEDTNTMPSVNELVSRDFTTKDWLLYYRNLWNQTLTARVIDTTMDRNIKDKNPEEVVGEMGPGNVPIQISVKERLENRKMSVQHAVDVLNVIDMIIKDMQIDSGVNFEDKYVSKNALKVAEDMIETDDVGGVCKTPDGKDGTWQSDGNGLLLCIPNETVEPTVEPSPAAAV